MSGKPKCIVVTGRPGAGKTTLSKELGRRLWMPVISRDQIKEGYVNTFGVKHDQLPPDTNGVVTGFFFEVVRQYLENKVSVVIEAAFQHKAWEKHLPKLLEAGNVSFVICSIDAESAANRHLQRGLAEPKREFYHGDRRVAVYRATGKMSAPGEYVVPHFNLPTIHVVTEGEYSPSIDEVVLQLQAQDVEQAAATPPHR